MLRDSASSKEQGGAVISDQTFQIAVLGETGTGKSSLVQRYVVGRFVEQYQETMAVSFFNSVLSVSQKNIKLQGWDAAGHPRYRGLVKLHLLDPHAYVVVYDVNQPLSLTVGAKEWVDVVRRQAKKSQAPIYLVGTKRDLTSAGLAPKVSQQMIRDFVQENNSKNNPLSWLGETSAKLNAGIDEVFTTIADNAQKQFCPDRSVRVLRPVATQQEISGNEKPVSDFDWHPWRHTRGKVASVLAAGLLLAAGAVAVWFFWPVILAASVAALIGVGVAAFVGFSAATYFSGLIAERHFAPQVAVSDAPEPLVSGTHVHLLNSGLHAVGVGSGSTSDVRGESVAPATATIIFSVGSVLGSSTGPEVPLEAAPLAGSEPGQRGFYAK